MALSFTYSSSGTVGQTADFARVAMRVGCCTGGVSGTVYEADPGQDLTSTIGYGPLAMADSRAARLASNAQRYLLKVAATIEGVISDVTKSGSGPTITVAGSAFDGITATPWIAGKFKIKITLGGALGTARAALAIDGGSYNYEFDIPAEAQGTVIGSVDITTLNYPLDLDTKTIVLDPGAVTVTFSSPDDPADAIAQLDAAAGFSADLIQGKYVRIRRDTPGAAASVEVDATSTADDELGLDNTVHSGAAATVTIPGTGLVLTFASGTYVKDEVYSFTTTAPRAALSAITAAITAAVAADPALDFGMLGLIQAPLDDVDLRAYADAFDALIAGWEAAEDPRYVVWFINAPIGGSDANDKSSMLTHVSKHGCVVSRDCYLTSADPQPSGRPQTMLLEQLLIRSAAAESFSEDPGFGGFGPLECTINGPDGTLARLDSTASIKLGGSTGPGFTVLTSKKGRAYFKRGVTRAGTSSRFVDLGVLRATKALVSVLHSALRDHENSTFALNPAGTISEVDAAPLDAAFVRIADDEFVKKKHFSAVTVQVNRAEVMSNTRTLKIDWVAQIRGQGEDIEATLVVSGTLAVTGTVTEA